MSQFDRLFLIVLPSINVAGGLIGVLIGVPPVTMGWLCGFAVMSDVAIFGWSRLYNRLGRIENAGLCCRCGKQNCRPTRQLNRTTRRD